MNLFRALVLFFAVVLGAGAHAAAPDNTIRVGIFSLPEGRGNPHLAIGPPYFFIWPALFDGLTDIDTDGKLKPALAVSWRFTDSTTWIFELRPDVTFANGEPLDAAAVVATMDYLLLPDYARFSVYNAVRGIVSARALGPLTVEIKTDAPDRLLPNHIGAIRILPPKYWNEVGPEGFAAKPIGTGPFVVQSWQAGRIQMAANPKSWRPPHVAALEIREIPEATSRVQALQSGALDLALGIGPDDKDAVEAIGGMLHHRPRGSVEVISFVTVKESPLKDRRVRQALNYAVDKQAIVDALLGGLTSAASQTAPFGAFGRDPDLKPYAYDPAKARALLAEAGYPNGFALTAEIVTGRNPGGAAVYQKVASDLSKIGIRMELRTVTQNQVMRAAYDGSFGGTAFSLNYGSLPYMDALAGLRLHSCLWQKPWNCDPAIAKRITEAYAAFDLAERERLTRQLVRDVRDEAPDIFLFEDVVFDGVGPRVKNYRAAFSTMNYEGMELAR